jgi:hypothetical protein
MLRIILTGRNLFAGVLPTIQTSTATKRSFRNMNETLMRILVAITVPVVAAALIAAVERVGGPLPTNEEGSLINIKPKGIPSTKDRKELLNSSFRGM